MIGIGAVGALAALTHLPLLLAPLGASAVLIFGQPASPLAQPANVFGGYLVATIVGVGLNILVGLAGQISIGHIGFYAIGAYAVAVLTLKGINFWLALGAAGVLAAAIGALLALPATLRSPA